MQPLLDSVAFSFPLCAPLFDGFSLDLPEGRTTAILGPSGCGKTTLLHLLARLYAPISGSVHAPRSSYLFQEPRLFPSRTILQNVAIPIENEFGKPAAKRRAEEFLAAVGLEGRERAYPDELSGGQRQRAALARAFAYPAPLMLMDEPFQSLDLPLRIQLMDLFFDLREREPRTAVVVTHDPREAIYMADRVIVLGNRPAAVVLDEALKLTATDRSYASSAAADLEARLFAALSARS